MNFRLAGTFKRFIMQNGLVPAAVLAWPQSHLLRHGGCHAVSHLYVPAWRLAAPHRKHVVPVDFRATTSKTGSVISPTLISTCCADSAPGIVHTVINFNTAIPSVGASGAIAGVLGAYLVFIRLPR